MPIPNQQKPTGSKPRNKGGRPTKFNEEAVEIAERYVADCAKKKTIPWIESLAVDHLNVDDDTVVEWMKAHDADTEEVAELRARFSATIKKLKTLQKRFLGNQGLSGKVNVSMAIFLLKANHGMKETERHELTGKDGKPQEVSNHQTITYMPKPLPNEYWLPKNNEQPQDPTNS